jgi:hypothetical protein
MDNNEEEKEMKPGLQKEEKKRNEYQLETFAEARRRREGARGEGPTVEENVLLDGSECGVESERK